MNCDANCDWGEEPTVFFSYIEDGKIRKVNLCKQCAAERGVDDPTGYSLVDMLQGMGQESAVGSSVKSGVNELTCEQCGFSQTDFKKTGRFGCANCYEVFSEGLESLLEAMHKNTEHTGKVPSFLEEDGDESVIPNALGLDIGAFGFESGQLDEIGGDKTSVVGDKTPEMRIAMLKDQLDLAISDEDYEKAADIRDQINKLEEEVNGSI